MMTLPGRDLHYPTLELQERPREFQEHSAFIGMLHQASALISPFTAPRDPIAGEEAVAAVNNFYDSVGQAIEEEQLLQ